jgi:hypothetical protein
MQKRLYQFVEPIFAHCGINVEQDNDFTIGYLDALITTFRETVISLIHHDTYLIAELILRDLHRIIAGTIVYQDHFFVGIRVLENRLQASPDKIFSVVIQYND